jgi:hypothetical protein
MSELRKLIERLDEAKGPDGDLDRAIFAIIQPERFKAQNETLGVREPAYTSSHDAAMSLLPWDSHPGATFKLNTVQSGLGEQYCFAEFTWPSTERQGRARTAPLAICICALLAVEETERQLAPYRRKPAPIPPIASQPDREG